MRGRAGAPGQPDKGDFVGRRALRARARAGRPAAADGRDQIDWAGIEREFARHDLPPAVEATVDRSPTPIYVRRGQVGRATSTCWSPTLKQMVALASVDRRYATLGSRLWIEWSVEGGRGDGSARRWRPLPFLDLERKRT